MPTKEHLRPAVGGADDDVLSTLQDVATPLQVDSDLDPLLDRIGSARIVMLGEASHGTAEYYIWRHRITERLIRENEFNFVAVEGDWPECYEVNRYLRGLDGPESPRELLKVFERWPTWMWANEEVVSLISTLEKINDARSADERVGFYGLDVYSLWGSLHAVLGYVRREAPELLDRVRQAYRCFEPFDDIDEYARAASWGLDGCSEGVVAMLASLQTHRRIDASDDPEAAFDAEQNALVVKNAESYYRSMVQGGGESWNVRDRHMAETLDRLLDRHGPAAKAIVWEHNTHIGDARATDMARVGMVNLGQLARERYAREDVVLVGFGSHRGSVIAADRWDAPMEEMPVPEARAGSWDDLMHRAYGDDRLLIFDGQDRSSPLHERRGHRAIGVVYHPESESGNYVPTDLAARYDAFLYLDETHALHPLNFPPPADEDEHDRPETYPSGM